MTRQLPLWVALAVAVMWLVSPATASAAPKSYLHVDTPTISGSRLTVRVALYDAASKPLVGESVTVATPSSRTTVRTGGDGWLSAQLEVPTDTPTVAVTASFAGSGRYRASSQTITVALPPELVRPQATTSSQPASQPPASASASEPASSAAQTPASPGQSQGAGSVLTATPVSTKATPGSNVVIQGTLRDASSQPIADGAIEVTVGDKKIAGADVTEEDGTFTTHALIPQDQAPGRVRITLNFPGGAGLGPATSSFEVEVAAASSEPTSSEPETTEPSASPTDEPSEQSEDPTDSAPQNTASTTATPPADDRGWLPDPIILVGGLAAMLALSGVVIAVAMRTRRQHHQHLAEDDPDDLIEAPPTVSAPEDLPINQPDVDPPNEGPRRGR